MTAETEQDEMRTLDWASAALLEQYHARQPDQGALARVDALHTTPPEFLANPDLNIRALENALGQMLANWLAAAAETLGEEAACRVAKAAGTRHGKRVLGDFLAAAGASGGAAAMAAWQDTSHSMRGPRHATGLFARFDATTVEVVRTDDSMGTMQAQRPPVLQSFMDGIVAGYRLADPSFLDIVETIRDRPDGQREFVHKFQFRPR